MRSLLKKREASLYFAGIMLLFTAFFLLMTGFFPVYGSECPVEKENIRASGACGDSIGDKTSWVLDRSGTLYIYGEGEVDIYYASKKWKNYIKEVRTIVFLDGITYIHAMLQEYPLLKDIRFASSVKSFGGCFMCPAIETITFPDTLEEVSVINECVNLRQVKLPKNLKKLPRGMFDSCPALEKVKLPENITEIPDETFFGCKSLKEIDIPKSVTRIGYEAFDGCRNLKSVYIPDGVTVIGGFAFEECSSLSSVHMPVRLKIINQMAFLSCSSLKSITIPDGVTTIGDGAFADMESLEKIIIPDSVTTLEGAKWEWGAGSGAFYGDIPSLFEDCVNLKSVRLPSCISTVKARTFRGCEKLETVIIPDKVTSIGEEAFRNCVSLSTISLPASIKTIADSAFDGTANKLINSGNSPKLIYRGTLAQWNKVRKGSDNEEYLTYVVIECADSFTLIPYENEDDDSDEPIRITTYTNPKTKEIYQLNLKKKTAVYKGSSRKLLKISIPDTIRAGGKIYKVIEIDENAMKKNKNLQTVKIGKNIKEIPSGLFKECRRLRSVSGMAGVTSIGLSAFAGCRSLKKVILPSTLKSFGAHAFQDCKALKSIIVKSTKLNSDSFGLEEFKGISRKAVIKVPKKKLKAYTKLFRKSGIRKTVRIIA